MADHQTGPSQPLKIMHLLRAPLGGLFRHVMDLARAQVARGHAVGIIADASTGGDNARRQFAALEPRLQLGLSRVPMRRNPDLSDLAALAHALRRMRQTAPDVIHGHGSKGGAYARSLGLVGGGRRSIRVYTPHGGSLNFTGSRLTETLYMRIERLLAGQTDLLLFESAFIGRRYADRVGPPRGLARVVHNGIGCQEFNPVRPAPDAADFLYVGELRAAKGIDTMIDALAEAGRRLGMVPRAVLVGTGPDKAALLAHAARLGLQDRIEFAGLLPARHAFERGRVLIVPSRAESLPYIVLEAAGAEIPMIATHVGGIPEIFGPFRDRLIAPDDAATLADRMIAMMQAPAAQRAAAAQALARHVEAGFSIDTMVDGVIDAYRAALALRRLGRPLAEPAIALSS